LTTFYTNSLSEAVIFLKSFIDVLPQNKLDRQISLIRGIYGNYVNQLIAYTKKDVLVGKFTHDKERFKNKKSFSSWMKHNKTIYTLVNSNQKMLGIIWFAKEKYEKYKYTFAIRTYPPLRGKGLAIKSIRSSFSDFDPNRKKSFWLSTNKENLIAKNVYKKIGFKEVETKENLIVMAKNN
jgi:ribosomal protein S18 acetylase RimI-like enzyme